jgi:SAM-dependent methyltransferase
VRELYDEDYFHAQDDFTRGARGYKGGYRDYIGDKRYYLQTFRKRMVWIKTYAGWGGRLLDVGCAAGFFLQVAKERGWQVQGVEPAAYVADYAQNQLGLEVFKGTLEEAQFPEESYEVVTIWDALEHMPDPHKTLTQVHHLLKPEGLLVLSTHNIDSWLAKMMGVRWYQFGLQLHLYYFSPGTLTQILRDTGFCVINITRRSAGKVCSLRFLVDKLAAFNGTLYKLADGLLSAYPMLAGSSIYINPGDEMIICARKESS